MTEPEVENDEISIGITDRCIKAIYEHGGNLSAFARDNGIPRNRMQNYMEHHQKLPAYVVAVVCKTYDIKPETILFGE